MLRLTRRVEIPHIQGQGNPSKMAGARAAVRRYPMSQGKGEAPQDGRRGKLAFRIKPHSRQRRSEGSNKPCAHQDPGAHRDWDRTVFEHLLRRSGLGVVCRRERGSGCAYGISPLGGGHH